MTGTKSPWYETDEDRERQERAAQLVESAWSVLIEHCDKLPWDWRIYNQYGMLLCLGEFKGRIWTHGRGDGIWLSEGKAMKIAKQADHHKVPWHFFVWLDDGLFSILMEKPLRKHFETRIGGRTTKTRDGDQPETVLVLPHKKFTLVDPTPRWKGSGQ